MNEKKYLKWYNKVGYGSGDIAGNVVYAFLSSFVMIYLTNTVGLNPGIIGTLIAVSKLFDGITDVFFGSLIDKTKSRLGKARPWMLYGYIGCAVTLVAIFAIPADMGEFAQYAWFFIAYTLLNAVFYTANNIAYSALTALVTKKQQGTCTDGFLSFYLCFFNQSSDPVSDHWICGMDGRRSCRMENSRYYLCSDRTCSEYDFRIFCEGTAGRRIK